MNDYKTSDFSLASTLQAVYEPLIDIDRTNPKRAEFCFRGSPELRKIITDYWNKKLRIEPLTFFDSIKTLKRRLYD